MYHGPTQINQFFGVFDPNDAEFLARRYSPSGSGPGTSRRLEMVW